MGKIESVERAAGLVHQHHFGIVGQDAGDGHVPFHATGELVRAGIGEFAQAHDVDEALDFVADLVLRAQAVEPPTGAA